MIFYYLRGYKLLINHFILQKIRRSGFLSASILVTYFLFTSSLNFPRTIRFAKHHTKSLFRKFNCLRFALPTVYVHFIPNYWCSSLDLYKMYPRWKYQVRKAHLLPPSENWYFKWQSLNFRFIIHRFVCRESILILRLVVSYSKNKQLRNIK